MKLDMLLVYVTEYARVVVERFLATKEVTDLKEADKYDDVFKQVKQHLRDEFQQLDPIPVII